MLEFKVIKLKNKDIEDTLSALLNKNEKDGWKFVETQIVTDYKWKYSSDLIVIFSKEI